MKARRTPKIWLGIGAAVAISGGGAAAGPGNAEERDAVQYLRMAQAVQHSGHAPAATAQQAGEAGEAGVESGMDPRVAFLRNLALIRGHLLVGGELVADGKWTDAIAHFHHPIEELYPSIDKRLKLHGIRPFDRQLKALAQTVQAKNASAYKAALQRVEERLAAAEGKVESYLTPRLRQKFEAVMAVLRTAAGEYGLSMEGGKFTKPVEYQDSRGFVWHAERAIEANAALLQKIDAVALAAVRNELAILKQAWPAASPPARPVKTHAEVLADIARVELAAGPYLYGSK